MRTMSHKGYKAAIEFDAEDEIFVGRVLGLRDVVGFHSDTVKGLKRAFHEALDDYLETCERVGKEPDKPYSGNLMLRIDPSVHARIAIAADAAGKSLNQWGEEVLRDAAERGA